MKEFGYGVNNTITIAVLIIIKKKEENTNLKKETSKKN